jgi:soluble lytic murein transglycosylase-like protein
MKFFLLALLLTCPWFAFAPRDVFNHPNSAKAAVLSRQPVDIPSLIRAAAQKHKVAPALVKSIVAVESNFNCDAVSAKGAIGLMQLMPSTASQYGVDPSIPEQNIDGGTHYLSVLLNKYRNYRNGLKHAIAAYNAGPAMVDHYRGIPPFRETRAYVARVLRFLHQFEKADA